MRNLAHKRQQILLRVAKEGHPQIVGWHFRDRARLGLEGGAVPSICRYAGSMCGTVK
jgi:hypothetical protein